MPEFKQQKNDYDIFIAFVGTLAQYTFTHPIWSSKISEQKTGIALKINFQNLPTLYRGYWLHVARAYPVALTQVSVGHYIEKTYPAANENLTTFYAGFVGGVLSAPIVTATDAVMTRQKLETGPNRFMWNATKALYNDKGYRGFTTSLGSTAIRNGGRAAAYFSVFPTTYQLAKENLATTSLTPTQKSITANIFSISTATFFATIATNPSDVIKTVQQSDKKVLSTMEAVKKIYREAGGRGFFRGMRHRLLSRAIEVVAMGEALHYIPALLNTEHQDPSLKLKP